VVAVSVVGVGVGVVVVAAAAVFVWCCLRCCFCVDDTFVRLPFIAYLQNL